MTQQELNSLQELETLKKYLKDQDLAISLYAVKALKKFSAAKTSGILIDFLENNSQNKNLRPHKLESLKILKDTKNPEHRQRLVNLLSKEDDPYILSALISCAGQVHDPGEYISSKILPFLTHEDSRVVSNAIEVISMQDSDLIKYSLKNFLFSKIPRQAMNAALGFYKSGEEQIFDFILSKAKSPEIYWHPSAIYAIGHINNEQSCSKLLGMIPNANEITKNCILKALKNCGNNNAITPLISCLLVEKEPEIQKSFISTLKSINEELTLAKLTEIWKSTGNPRIQATVIKSLGFYEDHSSAEIFTKGLNSSDPRVKANTIEAIMNRKLDSAVPMLMELVNSGETRIQCNAVLALWKMGYTYVIKNLKDMVSTADDSRSRSVQWLVEQMNLAYMFTPQPMMR